MYTYKVNPQNKILNVIALFTTEYAYVPCKDSNKDKHYHTNSNDLTQVTHVNHCA